jgi:hypothetical protein
MRTSFKPKGLALLCFLTAVCSCHKPAPPPALYPVHGNVRVDGKLLEAGVVEFQPLEELGHNALGEIQPDGDFSLSIVHEGKRFKGAVPGAYRVTVLFMAKAEKDKRAPLLLEKTYKIVEGDNTIDLDVKSP